MWIDQSNTTDGKDAIARKAAENVLVMDSPQNNASSEEFNNAVIENVHKWPFYCDDCPTEGNVGFRYRSRKSL